MDISSLHITDLLNLPEPVLVVGHTNPDGDSISTSAVLLDILNKNEKKCYFAYNGIFPKNLEWLIDTKYIPPLNNKYSSVIVVDSDSSKIRIGFDIPEDTPVLIIDHHPSTLKQSISKNVTRFVDMDSPSCSSILFNELGEKDPRIYIGLYYDCFLNRLNLHSASFVLSYLDIDDNMIAKYNELLKEYTPIEVVDVIRNVSVESYDNVFFVFAEYPEKLHYHMMSFYSKFVDTVALYNNTIGKVFIRCGSAGADLSKIAEKYKGGGAKNSIAFYASSEDLFDLKNELLNYLEELHGN